MDLVFTNVHALVTGASGGIGAFIAKLPLHEASVRDLFAAAGNRWKHEVQVLILSHGRWFKESDDLVDMELVQWNETVEIYLNVAFITTREFLRGLRTPRQGYEPEKSKVAVVLIGSICGEFGDEDHIDHACVSSALQIGFIRSLKHQLVKIAPAGRINAVAPGWVNTESARKIFEDKALWRRTMAATPLGRIAGPEDVGYQVLALASST